MGEVKVENPHWHDGFPAWDITLSSGVVHRGVTARQMIPALQALVNRGEVHPYMAHIDVVRRSHIEAYDRYHTST